MKKKDILLFLISSVILVIAWIIFSIIHQLATPTINANVNQAITPIDPTFDITVINTLKTREKVAPVSAAQPTVALSSPTPTPPSSSIRQQSSQTTSFTSTSSSPSALPTISLLAPGATQGGSTQ